MKRIMLFRFHDHPAVCKNRLELLKQRNPSTPIYGLFGGSQAQYDACAVTDLALIEQTYSIKQPGHWSWKHSDLAVREWFIEFGHTLDFDMLHIVEWDLLLLAPLEELYGHVAKGAIAVTARFPLKEIEHDWDWMTNPATRAEWDRLLSLVRAEYGYTGEPFGSLGPGTCLSRVFLEKYASAEVPELTNDEQRLPLFAQAFGIPVLDTKFRTSWDEPYDLSCFNCMKDEISLERIQEELNKPLGRRAFHPYCKPFNF